MDLVHFQITTMDSIPTDLTATEIHIILHGDIQLTIHTVARGDIILTVISIMAVLVLVLVGAAIILITVVDTTAMDGAQVGTTTQVVRMKREQALHTFIATPFLWGYRTDLAITVEGCKNKL